MKNQKQQKWEAARTKVVASASFQKLFARARKSMADTKRTDCKNGHPITAANAHVGDLKRTGHYSCDPCNRVAQLRYTKKAAKKVVK